jgi:hypothetical protein
MPGQDRLREHDSRGFCAAGLVGPGEDLFWPGPAWDRTLSLLGFKLKSYSHSLEGVIMKRTDSARLILCLIVWVVAMAPAVIPPEAAAVSFDFHGFLEGSVIVRDQNGFQNVFLDNLAAVQQRETLKFDVDTYLGIKYGDFALDKAHLTFRGGYDTIFHLRYDEYKNIRKEKLNRFTYGLYDIEYEADLREASVDFTYQGDYGSGFLRLGRQLVSWGETSGLTILDNINPADNSYQMFFLNPDDLKTPLWMGRLNYSLPQMMGWLQVNFDVIVNPDIRPQQWAVLDGDFESPYLAIHPFHELIGEPSQFFIMLGLQNLVNAGYTVPRVLDMLHCDIREDVDTSRTEFGGRVNFGLGPTLNVAGSYYEGISDMPGLEFADWQPYTLIPTLASVPIPLPTTVKLYHPVTRTYGGSFSWFVAPLDLIFKGEVGHTENVPIFLPVRMQNGLEYDIFNPNVPSSQWYIRGTKQKPVTMCMLGIDKDIWMKWFSPAQVNFGIQWIHKTINHWEAKLDDSILTRKNVDYFTLLMNWYWWNGRINPMIFALVDTQMDAMVQANVGWTITSHWYAKLAVQSFWGKQDWLSTDTQSEFSPFVSKAGEITARVGYQW